MRKGMRYSSSAISFIFMMTLPFIAQSQHASISGTVYDAQTKEPLAFATVSILNTTEGTTTDESGEYVFQLRPGEHRILFRFLSYNDTLLTIQLKANEHKELDIYLHPDTLQMKEFTVSANRVAKKIQNLARQRNEQNEQLKSFEADVYKLAILSSIGETDSTGKPKSKPIAFSERKSVIYYRASPERFTEQVEAHRASENFFSEYDFFSTGGGPLNLNQDEVSVSILSESVSVVGPVSEHAGEFYDLYERKAGKEWPDGTTEVYFKPVKKNQPLFSGSIWLDEESASILGIDVRLNDYTNTHTGTFSIKNIRYRQFYKKTGRFWLPHKTVLTAVVDFIGKGKPILYRDEWTWTGHRINIPVEDGDDISLNTIIVPVNSDEKGEAFWKDVQQEVDNGNLDDFDKAKSYKEDNMALLFGMKAMRSVFEMPVWLQNSYYTNFSDFYHFNRVEGHYAGIGLRTPFEPDYDYRIAAGYGFGNKSISYKISGLHYVKGSFFAPEFIYHKETVPQFQDYEYNRTPIDFFETQQTLNALMTGGGGINYFEREGFEAGFRIRFATESFLRALYTNENHHVLKTTTDYNVFGNDLSGFRLQNNHPLYPAQEGRVRGLYLQLHHDTRQYQQTQFLRDYNIRRFGWLSDIIVENGISGWNSGFNFTRYRVGLKFYWPVFTSHFFQTDITFGASDTGTPHQRIFSYNGFVVDDYVRYRPFNTINYKEPVGYRVSEIRIRYKFGTSLTRKLPVDFLAKSGIKISAFATFGVIDDKPGLDPVLPYSKAHTQAELGIAVSRIFGFFYTEFSRRIYGNYGSAIGFTARF